MELIFSEIKKILKTKEYKVIFAIMYICMLADFLILCSMFYGKGLTEVFSAHEMNVMHNISRSTFRMPFTLLLPVCVGFMGCSTYAQDRKNRMNNYIIARTSRKNYIIKKAVSIFLVAAVTVFLLLIMNLLLAVIAFPIYGNILESAQLNFLFVLDENLRLFGEIEYANPYLGLCIFMIFRSVFAGILGIEAYGLSMYIKNKYINIFSPFILHTMLGFVSFMVGKLIGKSFSLSMNAFSLYPYDKFIMYILPFVFNFVFAAVLIYRGTKKDEI